MVSIALAMNKESSNTACPCINFLPPVNSIINSPTRAHALVKSNQIWQLLCFAQVRFQPAKNRVNANIRETAFTFEY